MTFISYILRLFVNYPGVFEINIGYIIIIKSLIITIFATIFSLMTKSTPDVSTCSVLNHLQKHSFHLYFSKIIYPGRGAMPPPIPSLRSGAMLPLITLLAFGFLPSFAPDAREKPAEMRSRKGIGFNSHEQLHYFSDYMLSPRILEIQRAVFTLLG